MCYPAIKIVEYLTTAMWSHTPWQCGIGRSHQSRIVITVRYLRRGTSLLTFQIPVIDRIKRTVIVVGMQFRKAWGVWSSCWAVKIVGTSGTKHHVLLSSLRRRLKIPKSGNISIQEARKIWIANYHEVCILLLQRLRPIIVDSDHVQGRSNLLLLSNLVFGLGSAQMQWAWSCKKQKLESFHSYVEHSNWYFGQMEHFWQFSKHSRKKLDLAKVL